MKSVSIGCFGSAMLTRRTATVTISAPEAATAAAFSSKLLYLPVPTISREVKRRPATVHVSSARTISFIVRKSSVDADGSSQNRRQPTPEAKADEQPEDDEQR